MKVKTGKQVRRVFQFYRINFLFHPPYKIIADGSFLKACVDKKVDLRAKVDKIIGGKHEICTF